MDHDQFKRINPMSGILENKLVLPVYLWASAISAPLSSTYLICRLSVAFGISALSYKDRTQSTGFDWLVSGNCNVYAMNLAYVRPIQNSLGDLRRRKLLV